MSGWTRRALLGTVSGLGLMAYASAAPEPPLRETAAQAGLLYGAAAASYQLREPDFTGVLAREAGILVAEYEMKRNIVEPAPGQYDFSGGDGLLAFARANAMKLRGHTLVWFTSNPSWLADAVESARDDAILTGYIRAVMGHYRGAVHSWDVVNEAIYPEDGRADHLRNSIWLRKFGPGYLDLAFHTAKEADPGALLVYNDWGCEGGEPWNDVRRAITLDFLERARVRGVPIEGLGLQGHLKAFGPPVDQRKLARFLDAVAAMGLRVLVTELDVDDGGDASDAISRDTAVSDATRRFLDPVMDCKAAEAVLTWGLSDRFLKPGGWRAKLLGDYPRSLPLDADLNRTPMWQALNRAFAGRRS